MVDSDDDKTDSNVLNCSSEMPSCLSVLSKELRKSSTSDISNVIAVLSLILPLNSS